MIKEVEQDIEEEIMEIMVESKNKIYLILMILLLIDFPDF